MANIRNHFGWTVLFHPDYVVASAIMVLKQQASKYLKNYLLLTFKCPMLVNKHPEVVVLPDVVFISMLFSLNPHPTYTKPS